MRCPPLVLSPSLSPSLCSVCLVFFEERMIRNNRLEGKVPVSTVSTPSGRRTRPRTSESGGGAVVRGRLDTSRSLALVLVCCLALPQGFFTSASVRLNFVFFGGVPRSLLVGLFFLSPPCIGLRGERSSARRKDDTHELGREMKRLAWPLRKDDAH